MRGVPTSEAIKQEVVRMTLDKHTQREIASRLDISPFTVGRIQKEMCVGPIGNRRMSTYKIPDYEIKPGGREPARNENPPAAESCVLVTDRVVRLTGAASGFNYTVRLKGQDVNVETGYGDPFSIDVKDLRKFADEIRSLADQFDEMKKNPYRV